ncbi:WRKY transcription factor, partial [Trifolium medium]|nr:WRKY transcription factor [Trifolium medium]
MLCMKKRKNRMKRMVSVAAINEKITDILVDNYSWRNSGQKP